MRKNALFSKSSHISSMYQLYLVSGFCIGQYRLEYFHHCRQFCRAVMLYSSPLYNEDAEFQIVTVCVTNNSGVLFYPALLFPHHTVIQLSFKCEKIYIRHSVFKGFASRNLINCGYLKKVTLLLKCSMQLGYVAPVLNMYKLVFSCHHSLNNSI